MTEQSTSSAGASRASSATILSALPSPDTINSQAAPGNVDSRLRYIRRNVQSRLRRSSISIIDVLDVFAIQPPRTSVAPCYENRGSIQKCGRKHRELRFTCVGIPVSDDKVVLRRARWLTISWAIKYNDYEPVGCANVKLFHFASGGTSVCRRSECQTKSRHET